MWKCWNQHSAPLNTGSPVFVKRLCSLTKVPSLPGSSGFLISPPRPTPRSYKKKISILVTGTNCNELRGETNAGKSRLYSEATGVGRSGSHKEQQTHSGDGISWLISKQYTVVTLSTNRSRPVTIVQFQTKVGAPGDRSTGLGRPGWIAPTVLSI